MQEQASIAILSPNFDLATLTSNALEAHNPTRISLVDATTPERSSRVTSHAYFPAVTGDFVPPEIGSYISWGTNCLILVVDSSQGIDAATITFALQALTHHPTIIALTGLNHDRSSFDESVAVCQRVFGADRHVVATSLPVLNNEEEVQGILDLMTESIQWVNSDELIEEHDLDIEHYELITNRFDELLNALAVTTLSDAFAQSVINGEHHDADALFAEVVAATLRCEIIPVMPLSGKVGLAELAHLSSHVGMGTEFTWTPFRQSDTPETIATVLSSGLVRVWQGSLAPGEYLVVSPDETEGRVTITECGATDYLPSGRVTSASMSPPCPPGATISLTGISLQITQGLD